jgi:putative DNA primase/helicase
MTGKPPLREVSYQQIAAARAGVGWRLLDIPCPACGPTKQGPSARRKVLRTWQLAEDRISLRCARCGLSGYVVADDNGGTKSVAPKPSITDDDEAERKRRTAALASSIWREAGSLRATAGADYLTRRGIDLEQLPDIDSCLRWHPRCPWGVGETRACVVALYTDAISNEPRGIRRRPISGEAARSLGPQRDCVIRLWPDECVTLGLVLGEGPETTLAAATRIMHRNTLLQPAWAAGCADSLRYFPVLSRIESLTILVDNDPLDERTGRYPGQNAAAECARRWLAAGREVIRLTPRVVGTDFNDIVTNGTTS